MLRSKPIFLSFCFAVCIVAGTLIGIMHSNYVVHSIPLSILMRAPCMIKCIAAHLCFYWVLAHQEYMAADEFKWYMFRIETLDPCNQKIKRYETVCLASWYSESGIILAQHA